MEASAILAEPLVSSFTAIIRLPMQPEGGRICSRIPESREKSRIYPPNFVTVSKPFMIEVSKSSARELPIPLFLWKALRHRPDKGVRIPAEREDSKAAGKCKEV